MDGIYIIVRAKFQGLSIYNFYFCFFIFQKRVIIQLGVHYIYVHSGRIKVEVTFSV
jgi:hypothetical protein